MSYLASSFIGILKRIVPKKWIVYEFIFRLIAGLALQAKISFTSIFQWFWLNSTEHLYFETASGCYFPYFNWIFTSLPCTREGFCLYIHLQDIILALSQFTRHFLKLILWEFAFTGKNLIFFFIIKTYSC